VAEVTVSMGEKGKKEKEVLPLNKQQNEAKVFNFARALAEK